MHFFGYLTFLSGIIFLSLSIYVLLKNTKSILNISVAMLSLFLAIWCFPAFFYFKHSMSLEQLWLANHISSVGWIGFSVFFYWFCLIFTENKSKFFWFTFFVSFTLCFILMYMQITSNAIISYFVKTQYGWAYGFSNSIWFWTFAIYLVLSTGLGLAKLLIFYYTKKIRIEKKQAIIILSTTFFALTLGTINGIIFPKLGMYDFPGISHIIALAWLIGIVYIIINYQFLNISTKIAAEQIIATMQDALFLTDPYSDIVTVNDAGIRLLEGSERNIVGKPIDQFFEENSLDEQKHERLINQGLIVNEETYCKAISGHMIPVLLSCSVIKNDSGQNLGKVFLARDITERKKSQMEMQKQIDFSDAIINCLPGIFYMLNENGKFLKWNIGLEEISGYSHSEIVKMSPLAFFNERDKPKVQKAIMEVFREGESSVKAHLVTKDGKEIPYFFVGSLFILEGKSCLLGTGMERHKI